jgi:hypothetical protein
MHHGLPYLFILSCPFPVWGSLDSVILCEYKIRGSPFWGEKRAYGHFLQVSSPRDLKNILLIGIRIQNSYEHPVLLTAEWSYSFLRTTNQMSILNLATPWVGVSLGSNPF